MALLMDGSPNTVETLKAVESSIADVAGIELIDVDIKMGLALEEISESLMVYLIQLGTQDPQYLTRRQIGVSTIVLTPPLRRWHGMLSIALIYRDAYHNQLNERYLAKWKYFNAVSAEARRTLIQTGLGLVNAAVPKAPVAVTGLAIGQWTPGTYVVRMAWVDSAGRVGSPGEAMTVELVSGSAPTVMAPPPPVGIVGWNVYVAAIGSVPAQQNASQLGFATPWVAQVAGPVAGDAIGDGQKPDRYIADNQSFFRR